MKAAANTRAGPRRSTPQAANLAGRLKELRLLAVYRGSGAVQAPLADWRREAERLAREYLLTGREIHLKAFIRHVIGMLAHARSKLADKLANRGIKV